MKYLPITLLMTSLLAFGTTHAIELTPEEVLAAVDGESDVMDVERVNFDISINDTNDINADSFWKPANAGLLDDTYY